MAKTLPIETPGGTTCPLVVMVHGIFDRGDIFDRMAHYLQTRGVACIAPDFAPKDGRDGLEVMAAQLSECVQKRRDRDRPVYLVGYSMGGIICRYYMQRMDGAHCVSKWVTIASPHHGTYTAFGYPGKGTNQMRIGSSFLADLGGDLKRISHIPFLSLWTPFDLSIIPASSSILPIGMHEKFYVLFHSWMYTNSQVMERIADFLLDD